MSCFSFDPTPVTNWIVSNERTTKADDGDNGNDDNDHNDDNDDGNDDDSEESEGGQECLKATIRNKKVIEVFFSFLTTFLFFCLAVEPTISFNECSAVYPSTTAPLLSFVS